MSNKLFALFFFMLLSPILLAQQKPTPKNFPTLAGAVGVDGFITGSPCRYELSKIEHHEDGTVVLTVTIHKEADIKLSFCLPIQIDDAGHVESVPAKADSENADGGKVKK